MVGQHFLSHQFAVVLGIEMTKLVLLTSLFSFVALSSSQECDPNVVEWKPHQYSCSKFILCYHGNPLEKPCAPGLHFSPTELKCMFPERAQCDINYSCPADDDVTNPIFLPDRFDCQRFYVCFLGSPIQRHCAENLWWDVERKWCTTADVVICDPRTPNNPREPLPTTPPPPPPPITDDCFRSFNISDPETGAYIKSACTVSTITDYENAQESCRDKNMQLFVINDSIVQQEFFEGITNTLSAHPNGHLWINGRREGEGDWFTFNPNRASLYIGVDWVRTETIDGRTSGDCLRYSSEHGPYQAMGGRCDFVYSWFTCEYNFYEI